MKRTGFMAAVVVATCALASPGFGDAPVPMGKVGSDCSLGGKKLYGKVKVVDHFPDSCGKWQMVDHFLDFTIQYVDHFPDFDIQKVQHFPGVP